MCFYNSSIVATVGVSPREGFQEWAPVLPAFRRNFIIGINQFRHDLIRWFRARYAGACSKVPKAVYNSIFRSQYEDFHTHKGFNVFRFLLILVFFEANEVAVYLRRRFWLLILTEPIFAPSGGCGSSHDYAQLYLRALSVDVKRMRRYGSFYSFRTLNFDNSVVIQRAFNVWECRGIWREGANGIRRLVDTKILQVTGGEIFDWRDCISPETVKK